MAVTKSKYRNMVLEDALVAYRSAIIVDGIRAAGEDDSLVRLEFFSLDLRRNDFGVDVELPDAAGNEMSVLSAEIDDSDFFHATLK